MTDKKENELPAACVERLIRKAGAERVSQDASEALRDILEEVGVLVSGKALEFSKHAKKKTVTGKDIKLAGKPLDSVKIMLK